MRRVEYYKTHACVLHKCVSDVTLVLQNVPVCMRPLFFCSANGALLRTLVLQKCPCMRPLTFVDPLQTRTPCPSHEMCKGGRGSTVTKIVDTSMYIYNRHQKTNPSILYFTFFL